MCLSVKDFRANYNLLLSLQGNNIGLMFAIKLHIVVFYIKIEWFSKDLTQDTPEGSIMYNSGPSGPLELNRTLQGKEHGNHQISQVNKKHSNNTM